MNERCRKKIFLLAVLLPFFLLSCSAELPKREEIVSASDIRVVDGDTVLIRGDLVRLLGVDAPEAGNPDRFVGDQGRAAFEAKSLIERRIRQGKVIRVLYAARRDTYGRLLAHLLVDEENLSLLLVKMGLAYENVSVFGDNGFPEIAAKIREASLQVTPEFEEPYKWRKKHRIDKPIPAGAGR